MCFLIGKEGEYSLPSVSTQPLGELTEDSGWVKSVPFRQLPGAGTASHQSQGAAPGAAHSTRVRRTLSFLPRCLLYCDYVDWPRGK